MDKLLEIAKAFPWHKVLWSFVIIAGAAILWKCFNKMYFKFYKSRRDDGEKRITKVVHEIAGLLLIIIVTLSVLQVCGVNVTSLIAGLGIASAIVGLALQDILKDLITGLHIITDDFFAVGDGVEFDGKEGVIQSVNLKTTKIRLLSDNSVYSVCNRNIEQIRKLSDSLVVEIPLGYGEDVKRIKKALTEAAKRINTSEIISDCAFSGALRFDSSAIIYKLIMKCKPENREKAYMLSLSVIQDVLEQEHISIPFNQLDVHLDK